MATSNIIVDIKYRKAKNLKYGLKKWAEYVCDPKKCDPTSIDQYNIINDYIYYSDSDAYGKEDQESFAWSSDGDINVKSDIKSQKLELSGTIWKLMISFPPDFALNNGLITKIDFYELTKNIMPSLFVDAGLNINNVNWYASLHRNTKNPHMHICFYQKKNIHLNSEIPKSSIYKLRSNIANYLIDNNDFYIARENEFRSLSGTITFEEFTKIKSQKFFGNPFRNELNRRLIALYNKLPKNGRLQYNSKNMKPYKKQIDNVIEYILSHDSIKYQYAEYDLLLQKNQKKMRDMYGNTKENLELKYYKDQINKLYSKIGNEILTNFKVYQSQSLLDRERIFLNKNIDKMNFKSRNDYAKEETKILIAKDLYKICVLANLNYEQTKKIFNKWLLNSKYNFNADILISSFNKEDTTITSNDLYKILKRLGYDYEKYKKYQQKNFYKDLNYKRFFNNALNHLLYELEREEKNLVEEMRYELS